ncbi:YbjN domain-containing protein [Aliagarivorans marinus]|uniref:YbjN domain-containing protein n=1 Tax=Aliagarivorans marinus TaxID=561965 RepID=UPI0003F9F3F7|nr:YbjN domain-containing protein [Aliagarivorans marinus]
MKNVVVSMLFAMLVAVQLPANAMKLSGEEASSNPTYKPTRSAVEKAMAKMGYDYEIDSDGDIVFETEDNGYIVYVIYDVFGSDDRLWNLRMLSQFTTKKSRYEELLEYVNQWNADKKYPKIFMDGRDTLSLELNFPIQYGFNPDEFEDNVIGMFENTIKQIAEDTKDMRL